MAKFKRTRPTIGILPGYSALAGKTPDHYRSSILKGIQLAGRVRECNLLLAWSLGHTTEANAVYPPWPVISPESDFVPVGPWNTDGLIVFTPIQNEVRSQYLQELTEQRFPVLFIATGEQGPTISVDNEAGIRQSVEHLAIVHGRRRIAFLAGHPNDRGDSASRLRAFRSALVEFGLDEDPKLVETGLHTVPGGYEATRKMIEAGVQFTALMGSNDASAIGAMQAIRDYTFLQVPRDVAVIGFDDQPDAMAQVPPLASVHVPLMEIGQQALALMHDHLKGNQNLASIQIPTQLRARQSCGCLPQAMITKHQSQPRSRTARQPVKTTDIQDIQTIRHKLAEEMVAAFPPMLRFPFGEQTYQFCIRLIDAFFAGLKEGNISRFQVKLMEFLREMEHLEENVDMWQNAISALRREMIQLPATWNRAETKRLADDMLHQARSAISESAQRQVHRHKYRQSIADQILGELTARLSATLDQQQAVEILEENLSEIGIKHVRVGLFEPDEDDPVAWSVAIHPGLEPVSRRFPSRGFPPPGLYPADEILNLIILPLIFQKELFGYVAFDADNLEPCATVARQLAATIKISRLHAQVTELSLRDPLTGIYNRRYFDLFLDNELNRSARLGKRLAVIILDIDHFKIYNDTYGHPAGDKVIQNVARCIGQGRRSADAIARIGGEEFALILPEVEVEGSLIVAEKIRDAIRNSSGFEHPITVSMGVSVSLDDSTGEALVKEADLALYEAKQTGRDRVCVFKK